MNYTFYSRKRNEILHKMIYVIKKRDIKGNPKEIKTKKKLFD